MKDRCPFIPGRPVESDEFVGREDSLRFLFNRLRTGSSVFVSGPPRIGKTSLLRKARDQATVARFVPDPEACRWTFSMVDLQDLAARGASDRFWSLALSPLRTCPEPTVASLAGRLPPHPDSGHLAELFEALREHRWTLIVLIDEADCFHHDPGLGASFWLTLRTNGGSRVGLTLVLASRWSRLRLQSEILQLDQAGSEALNQMTDLVVPPFTDAEVKKLLKRGGARLTPDRRRDIARIAGPTPRLLQETALRFWEESSASGPAILRRLQPVRDAYFSELLLCAEPEDAASALLLGWAALNQLSQPGAAPEASLGPAVAFAEQRREQLRALGISFPPPDFESMSDPMPKERDLLPVLFTLWVKEQGHAFLETSCEALPPADGKGSSQAHQRLREVLSEVLDHATLKLVADAAGVDRRHLTSGNGALEGEVDDLIVQAIRLGRLSHLVEAVRERLPQSEPVRSLPAIAARMLGKDRRGSTLRRPWFINQTGWLLLHQCLRDVCARFHPSGRDWHDALLAKPEIPE